MAATPHPLAHGPARRFAHTALARALERAIRWMPQRTPDGWVFADGDKQEDKAGDGKERKKDDNVRPIRPNNANDGPPDLDELWRDFNNKLGGLFSGGKQSNRPGTPWQPQGGGAGGNGGFKPPSGAAAGAAASVIGGIVLLLWLASGIYVVQEGEQAVITRFGKFKGPEAGIRGAGINMRLPWPIERHEIVSVTTLRSVEVGRNTAVANSALKDSSMLTQDENIVDVRFNVQYRVSNAADYLFNNVGPEQAVVQAAESAVREVVGKSTTNVVLYEKREAISGDILKSTQAQLDLYKTGLTVASVNIQNVQAPEQVQSAFDDALKAGQDGDRAKSEGLAYANDIVPRAEGRASRLKEEADGYKSRVVAQAEGDAARFKSILTEYQRAPQVTRDRMYTDAMQQIYASTTKILVDSRSGNNLLSLPLDRLLQINSAPPAVEPAASTANTAPAASPPPTTTVDPRTRDDGRSRNRDGR